MSAWQPAPPSPRLVGRPWTAPAWVAYLRGQGYAADEAERVLEGVRGAAAEPGLGAHVRAGLAALASEARTTEATQGLVVGYLEARPPLAVLDLSPAPWRHLSPAQLGARLRETGGSHELGGPILVDVLTAERWWARAYSAEQVGHVVAAGALYRLAGVASPSWRLVEVDGRLVAACPALREWARPRGALLADAADVLAVEEPADAWLANYSRPSGLRLRDPPIPGLARTLRLDLAACLGYRSPGRRDPAWSARMPEAADLGPAGLPTMRRIGRLPSEAIRHAVSLGRLPGALAAELVGRLVGRREALLARVRTLTA